MGSRLQLLPAKMSLVSSIEKLWVITSLYHLFTEYDDDDKSKMPFSSLRFGQFCDFRPKVYFSASGSKRFEILLFSSGSLTPSIFLR
ncbi:hypothetical protein Hanom_Chr07g00668241 [Helianthus anomalus]